MNSVNSKVILKKLQRISNVTKYAYNLVIDISNGQTEIHPVYKIPNKLTVIDVYDELISILIKLNINFVVENNAPRKGRIGIKIIIKTRVNVSNNTLTNGNNTTKIPTIKGGIKGGNAREFNHCKENIP
jgi:hypothetical protein